MEDYLGRIALEFRDIVQARKAGAGKKDSFVVVVVSRKWFEPECAYKSPNSDSVGLG